MFFRQLSILFALASFALVGCSPDPVNETHTGELATGDSQHPRDQSFYDEYKFKAAEGWNITVTMTSDAFDTYLQLRREGADDSEFLMENDDVVSGNTNSTITTAAPAGGTYVVWANSLNTNETGPYTVTISAQPAAAQ